MYIDRIAAVLNNPDGPPGPAIIDEMLCFMAATFVDRACKPAFRDSWIDGAVLLKEALVTMNLFFEETAQGRNPQTVARMLKLHTLCVRAFDSINPKKEATPDCIEALDALHAAITCEANSILASKSVKAAVRSAEYFHRLVQMPESAFKQAVARPS